MSYDGYAGDIEGRIRDYVDGRDEEVHGVVVARPGAPTVEVYYEPHGAKDRHILNSCTKSFLSTLVGIAIDMGYLSSVHTPVLDYFDDCPHVRPDPRRARITVEHLLTMASGIQWPQTTGDNASDRMGLSPDWIQFILEQPMAAEPGSVANYSNGDAHLLSALLQRATGVPTVEFAQEHLFAPLGITDIRWERDPAGVTIGSAALYMPPRDMAKLGLLYLTAGQHEGRQVVSPGWIQAATRPHTQIHSGRPIDYGYYWWVHPHQAPYEAWGGQGQRIACFPQHQAVIVTTADIADGPSSTHASGLYSTILSGLERSDSPPHG